MSLHREPNSYRPFHIVIAGAAAIGGWWIWKNAVKKKRESSHDQVNQVLKNIDLPAGLSEKHGDAQEMSPLLDMCIPQERSCVLYHSYVSVNERNICKPSHWHATYWLRFVEISEQEPRCAIVQQTDTKRYYLLMQVSAKYPLPCDRCIAPHEVYRVPVQDHYGYFEFAPRQGLDGFASLQHAQEAAQTLSTLL